jgi:plasmid stabilization system protein ParE/Arc/MetJ-type ribon-helix-helix transcriptional regulator
MSRTLSPSEIPEEVTRFAEAQVAAGRFASVGDVLLAGVKALEQRDATDAERARLLRAAWDDGKESLRLDGPQLESDEDFESFMDNAESEALRQH